MRLLPITAFPHWFDGKYLAGSTDVEYSDALETHVLRGDVRADELTRMLLRFDGGKGDRLVERLVKRLAGAPWPRCSFFDSPGVTIDGASYVLAHFETAIGEDALVYPRRDGSLELQAIEERGFFKIEDRDYYLSKTVRAYINPETGLATAHAFLAISEGAVKEGLAALPFDPWIRVAVPSSCAIALPFPTAFTALTRLVGEATVPLGGSEPARILEIVGFGSRKSETAYFDSSLLVKGW